MSNLKTVSFDPAEYRLVPITSTTAMDRAAENIVDMDDTDAERIYEHMLAATTDTLPGVVVHSGKPCGWLEKSANFSDTWFLAYSLNPAAETIPLFTHPPAQPDTAQAIHYPECWDVAAYPTLESALSEIAEFKCSECQPDTEALNARIAELEAQLALSRGRYGKVADCEGCAELEAQLTAQAGQDHPDAWRIDLHDSRWFTDDLDSAIDDLTNHNAFATPLYEMPPAPACSQPVECAARVTRNWADEIDEINASEDAI
jgi:hypothetical protein